MTNQDVIEMVSLGLSDEVIIEKLRTSSGSDFDTSVSALKVLKTNHVSDAVIRIMINPSLALAPAGDTVQNRSAISAEPTLVPETGVYVVENSRPTVVPPEIVNWQTGGVAKSTFSLGIVKGDKNGKINGTKSRTQLSEPLEFLVSTPADMSVEEYQLLRLHRKGNRREFRSVTGGVLHVSGGATRDDIAFQSEKIGIRTWRISLSDLPNGEYGFLPPGIASASISSSGKMYTFGVVDSQGAKPTNRASKSFEPAESPAAPGGKDTIGASSSGNPTIRPDGVTLTNVVPGGPADRVGIKPGDVILAINDHYLYTAAEMSEELRRYSPGTSISLRYLRYSIIYDVPVVLETAKQ